MTRQEKAKEIVTYFGSAYVFLGFVIGVLFTLWVASNTTIINVKHEDKFCTNVTIDDEPTQQICKGTK